MLAFASGWLAPTIGTKHWIAAVPQFVLDPLIATFFEDQAKQVTLGPTGPGLIVGATPAGGGPLAAPLTRASGPWTHTLLSWRLRRELREVAAQPDGSVELFGDVYPLITETVTLIQTAPTHERRGLADALGRTAVAARSATARGAAIAQFVQIPDVARHHRRWLWEAAREGGHGASGEAIASALFAGHTGAGTGLSSDRAAAWLNRVLAEREMTPEVRYGMHRVALDQRPAMVEVVAADVARPHGEDLIMSVKLLARRPDGQVALARLLEQGPVEARRSAATALCRIYTREPSLRAALERAQQDDDDAQVRRLAAEAVAFNGW